MLIKKGTFLELLPRWRRELWQASMDIEACLYPGNVLGLWGDGTPSTLAVSALLTKHEAAQQAGVSYDTIRYWLKNGLPHTMIGNQVFIDSLTLMDWK